jgi:hypothetical protein
VGAAERDEWLRATWRVMIAGTLDTKRLVLVDECSINTSLGLLHAWSPKGERAYGKVPRSYGPNITLLASMTREGMGPCLAVEGATTREVGSTLPPTPSRLPAPLTWA